MQPDFSETVTIGKEKEFPFIFLPFHGSCLNLPPQESKKKDHLMECKYSAMIQGWAVLELHTHITSLQVQNGTDEKICLFYKMCFIL